MDRDITPQFNPLAANCEATIPPHRGSGFDIGRELAAAAHLLSQPVCVKDDQGQIIAANDAFTALFGIKVDGICHETSKTFIPAEIELDQEALRSDEPLRKDTIFIDGHGELRDFTITSRAYSSADAPTAEPNRILTIFEDSSELNRLRQDLAVARDILESALEIYFAIDWRRMCIIDLNQRAASTLGYSAEEFIALDPSILFPQYSYKRLRQLLRSHCEDPELNDRQTAVMRRKDGSLFEIEMLLKPVKGSRPDCVAAVASDITERNATYEQLYKANHSLRVGAAVQDCLINSQSEDALVQSVCDALVEERLFFSVYAHIESGSREGASTQFRASNSRDSLATMLDDYGDNSSAMRQFVSDPDSRSAHYSVDSDVLVAKPLSLAAMLTDLRCEGKSIGCLAIFSKQADAICSEEALLIEDVASKLAFGIISLRREQARVRAEKRIARSLKVESALSQFSSVLLTSAALAQGLRSALPALGRATGADHIFVYDHSLDDGLFDKRCDWVKPGIRYADQAPHALAAGEGVTAWLTALHSRGTLEQSGYELPKSLVAALRLDSYSRLVSYPIIGAGGCIGFIGFCRTKTKRQWDETVHQMLGMAAMLIGGFYRRIESEDEMRMLASAINNSDEGVFISRSRDGYLHSPIVFVNEALTRIVGFSKNEMVGQHPPFLFPDGFNFEGDAVAATQARFQRKSGGAILAEAKVYPIREDSGVITHYITIVVDITKRHELQTKLAFANKMESIGQLAAGIAHEINTPTQFIGDNLQYIGRCWTAIQPALECLIESGAYADAAEASPASFPLPPTKLAKMAKVIPEAIADACEGSERIATIVKAMKEFSHPEKRMTVGDINKCIRTTITVARNEWKYVSDLETELDELPPVRFMPGDINQALLNLIVNAAHAIADKQKEDRTKGRIHIRSQLVRNRVRVSISDTGCGIPDKISDSVFNPFFTTKEVGKGTGQGLYLAHQVIEQGHGGRIWFESELGVGTTFHFELPLAESDHELN